MKKKLIQKTGEYTSCVFSRQEANKQLEYTISANTLANLDTKGLGSSQKLHICDKAIYEKKNFLEWR